MSSNTPSRSITDSQQIAVSPERLFRTLVTGSEIEIWWQARKVIVVPEKGGFWCGSWGKNTDHPDYVMFAELSEFDPPHRLVMSGFRYFSRDGSGPNSDTMVTEFSIEDKGGEPQTSLLTVTQSGFPQAGNPDSDAFYEGCLTGWRNTLQAIDEYFHVE